MSWGWDCRVFYSVEYRVRVMVMGLVMDGKDWDSTGNLYVIDKAGLL